MEMKNPSADDWELKMMCIVYQENDLDNQH